MILKNIIKYRSKYKEATKHLKGIQIIKNRTNFTDTINNQII